MRLIPQPPGKIVGGRGAGFEGQRPAEAAATKKSAQVRGNKIAMIFQDPMTSLNPVLTIGHQISEALELHLGMDKRQARKRTHRAAGAGRHSRGGRSPRRLPAPVLRRHAPARDDRHGAVLQPAAADRRRADHRAGRDHPGADHRPGQDDCSDEIGHGDHLDHPRPGRGGRAGRPRDRDVCRLHRRRLPTSRTCTPIRGIPTRWACWARCPAWMPKRKSKLTSIEGLPPDLIDLPKGCPFAPRCTLSHRDSCLRPRIRSWRPVGPGHRIACWVDVHRRGKTVSRMAEQRQHPARGQRPEDVLPHHAGDHHPAPRRRRQGRGWARLSTSTRARPWAWWAKAAAASPPPAAPSCSSTAPPPARCIFEGQDLMQAQGRDAAPACAARCR